MKNMFVSLMLLSCFLHGCSHKFDEKDLEEIGTNKWKFIKSGKVENTYTTNALGQDIYILIFSNNYVMTFSNIYKFEYLEIGDEIRIYKSCKMSLLNDYYIWKKIEE